MDATQLLLGMKAKTQAESFLRPALGVLMATAWAAACTTQYIAHEFGFSDVLGPPLLRSTDSGWVAWSLSHAAAAAAGVGAYVLIASKAWRIGIRFLAGASILLLLGSGPIYSPHFFLVWISAMWGEPVLATVFQRAVAVGLVSASWGGFLVYTITRKEAPRRRSPQPDWSSTPEDGSVRSVVGTDAAAPARSEMETPAPGASTNTPPHPVQEAAHIPGNASSDGNAPAPGESIRHDLPVDSEDALRDGPHSFREPTPDSGRGI